MSELLSKLERFTGLAIRRSSRSLKAYLDLVVINSEPRRRFGLCREPWQNEIIDPLIPAVEAAVGLRKDYDGPRFFWYTLPRGHDKTSLQARLLNWALAFAPSPIHAVVAAAERNQAGQVPEFMKREADLLANHWFASRLKFIRHEVRGPGGHLGARSSDAPSASGLLADIFIIDEVTFWKRRDLYDVLFSGAAKKQNAVFIVITNAGLKGSNQWQWVIREEARKDHGWFWHFYESPEYTKLASWISTDKQNALQRTLLPSFAMRVLDNVWVDPSETEAQYLARDQLAGCIDHSLTERTHGERGITYVLAGDLAISHDRATMAVTHREQDRVVLDVMKVWTAPPDGRIDFEAVQSWADQTVKAFRIRHAIFDNHQAEFLTQYFEKQGLKVTRYSFQGSGHKILAENLKTLVLNTKIVWSDDAGKITLPNGTSEDLVTELSQLVTVEQGASGLYRVDHLPGKHDDRYTSLALAAFAAIKLPVLRSPQVLTLPAKPKPENAKRDTSKFAQVSYLKVFNTYQAVPEVNGTTLKLCDYELAAEAAYAVNVVHELLGSQPPNTIPAKDQPADQRAVQVRNDMLKQLRDRRLLPVRV